MRYKQLQDRRPDFSTRITGLRTLVHGTDNAVRSYTYSSCIKYFRRTSQGTLSRIRRRCGACKNCEISRVFMKPGVALASCASSLGPIKSDRQRSHGSRSCWCTQVLSPRRVPARHLILLWCACLNAPSTRLRTFSRARFSGAAFSRQSSRVQNRSPVRLGKSTGLILRSLDARLFLSLHPPSPGFLSVVPGYLAGSQ